jgi:hypothetical protein
MDNTFHTDAASPSTVASRFGAMAGVFLTAMIIYWAVAMVATAALTRDRLGQDTANLVGAGVATVLVVAGGYFYAAYVCKSISRGTLAVTPHGFTIKAMQKLRSNEYHFNNDKVERVVYGEKLNGMEKFLDRLDSLRVPRVAPDIQKDLKKGRLFILLNDGTRIDFQFVDKAFDDSQLLAFFEALDANDVPLEYGG